MSRHKTGKNIKCKTCGKSFYISGSRISIRKYCSKECAKKDQYGFKSKEKKCAWCESVFKIDHYLRQQDKYCCNECKIEAFKNKQKERYERLKNTPVIRVCKECGKKFQDTAYFKRTYCSNECQFRHHSKNRKGKDNPNYKSGLYTKRKRVSRQQVKHLTACQKYRRDFLKKHDHLFCEVCRVNQNGTPQFQVHHIYPASLYPRHKELHNPKNLIMVCLECHHKFHAGKTYEKESKRLEQERGLKKLFDCGKLIA